MKSIVSIGILSTFLLLAACENDQNKPTQIKVDETTIGNSKDSIPSKTFAVSDVNNKKDPTCGMPVTAGINDTAHYDGHVLGFCSTECKNEFLKNPKAGLAAAELK